jgi:hypothetical protein
LHLTRLPLLLNFAIGDSVVQTGVSARGAFEFSRMQAELKSENGWKITEQKPHLT